MPLGGTTNAWDETAPADSRLAGLGATDIRSILTNIRGPLDSEHLWPSTGGANAGMHRQGSAVVFYGASSKVSSTDTDGRVMVDSTKSRLWNVGSSSTFFLGGRYAVEAGPAWVEGNTGAISLTSSKLSQVWTMECGRSSVTNSNTTVSLQNTYVTPGAVVVVTAIYPNTTIPDRPVVHTGTVTSSFQVDSLNSIGDNAVPSSAYSLNWIAMGFKAL